MDAQTHEAAFNIRQFQDSNLNSIGIQIRTKNLHSKKSRSLIMTLFKCQKYHHGTLNIYLITGSFGVSLIMDHAVYLIALAWLVYLSSLAHFVNQSLRLVQNISHHWLVRLYSHYGSFGLSERVKIMSVWEPSSQHFIELCPYHELKNVLSSAKI